MSDLLLPDGHYAKEGYVKGTHPLRCRWCRVALIVVRFARICTNCDSPEGTMRKQPKNG